MVLTNKLNFVPVTVNHAKLLKRTFETQSYRTCGFTVGSAIMWRKIYNLKICEYADTVILCADYPNEGRCFSIPLGNGDIKSAMLAVYESCRQNGDKCIFSDVPEGGLELLKEVFGEENCAAVHSDEWDDYVYLADDLSSYAGKKFNGQRNHVNKFNRLYQDAQFLPINKDNYDLASHFLREYITENSDGTLSGEVESCADIELMKHYFELGLHGAILCVDNKIISISVGEQIGDTLFIHIEKGDTKYQGVYQVMVLRFAQKYAKNAVYINREEDDGVEGLRKSKLSYHPVTMIKKYSVEIK